METSILLVGPLKIVAGEACAMCSVCKGTLAYWSRESKSVMRCGDHWSCYLAVCAAMTLSQTRATERKVR